MAKIKKLGIFSVAKLQAVIMGSTGLAAGVLYSFGGLVIDTLVTIGWISPERASTSGLGLGTVLAFGALIGMPLIFAGLGVVLGVFGAVIYNGLARWHGGIDIDIER